jgi:hypothetical protein
VNYKEPLYLLFDEAKFKNNVKSSKVRNRVFKSQISKSWLQQCFTILFGLPHPNNKGLQNITPQTKRIQISTSIQIKKLKMQSILFHRKMAEAKSITDESEKEDESLTSPPPGEYFL